MNDKIVITAEADELTIEPKNGKVIDLENSDLSVGKIKPSILLIIGTALLASEKSLSKSSPNIFMAISDFTPAINSLKRI